MVHHAGKRQQRQNRLRRAVALAKGESSPAKHMAAHATVPPLDRYQSRFSVRLPVQCTRLTGHRPIAWRGRTANISGGGLAVDLPTRLLPHTRVAVEIQTGIGPLRMEADILWTRRVPGKVGITRHGLCLADRSVVLDLPIHALLGEWLWSLARQEAKQMERRGGRGRAGVRTRRVTGR